MATLQINFLSLTLGMQANFSVFLPSYVPSRANAAKDYSEIYPRGERFRALWLIGSEYGDDAELLNNTAVARYAQENNLAVIMPATNNKLYSEDPKGQKFLRHITEELWTICTGQMAISPKREDNFIGGVSLGAYAALKAALRNPDKYSKVLMIDGAFGPDLFGTYLKDLNAKIAAEGLAVHVGLDDAGPEDYELFDLAKGLIQGGGPKPKISVSVMENGELAGHAAEAADNLQALGFDTVKTVYAEQNEWEYRDAAIRDGIRGFLAD